MTSRIEFAFPDYDLATLPPVPSTWVDVSYSNDTCPSFETCSGLVVYADYADPALRECAEQGESERFSVFKLDSDGYAEQLFWGDDWDAILAYVEAYPAIAR